MSGERLVLGVDGGNSKTDVALVDSGGALRAFVRGRGSSPHELGIGGCVDLLGELLERARDQAARLGAEPAVIAHFLLAGADSPQERAALHDAIAQRGWSERVVVDTDTVALLRSGTDRGWGLAVVCGAGINCLGVAPDGREARFLSLGPVSGDWGGGLDVGMAALAAAARSADGRGPATALEAAVAQHFGVHGALDVSRALHLKELPIERVAELAAVVFDLSGEDAVAAGIVGRLADEVIAFARAAVTRLELGGADPDVILGGRLLRTVSPAVIESIAQGIHEAVPAARVLVSQSDPIVGAVLLGLDVLGADHVAHTRARAELDAAAAQVGVTLVRPAGASGS